jgi:sugar O-acyltransferase (sialic acid O-acetyltransferase NeuD family)
MKIVLYGASGHGKVIADILSAIPGMELVGFIDDNQEKYGRTVGRFSVLGGADLLPKLLDDDVEGVIISIGHNEVRMRKADLLMSRGYKLYTAIHPSTVLAPDVEVGSGTVIMAGVVINAGTRVGRSVIVNTGSTVDHDCVLEDGCHLSPGVHLAGNVRVGKGAHVGIGASVIQNVTIGDGSIIGAGAVVIRDILPGITAVGVPARELIRQFKADIHE